jgi:carbamoyltransferase
VCPQAGSFHRLLSEFQRLSGIPLVLNTSLNGPGEPIVESPDDALRYLLSSDVDAVFLEGFHVSRAGAA